MPGLRRVTVTARTGHDDDVALTPGSRIRLYDLHIRRDGDEWIIGRVETGVFIAVPRSGARAVELLGEGLPVEDTGSRLRAETGEELDVAGFAAELMELGFVAGVDGRALTQPTVSRVSLEWLRPEMVRWLLSPVVPLVVVAFVVAAAVTALLDPAAVPHRFELLWSPYGSLVLVGEAILGWTLVYTHELAHLSTARAAGVPGRIGLGTRLYFLVAQTDVSGVWAAPRRVRLRVYLAGIAADLTIGSVCLLLRATLGPAEPWYRLLGVIILLELLVLPWQFLVFMRTDVYFVLQDLGRCRNLYVDGSAYARHVADRLIPSRRRRRTTPPDPSRNLPAGERRIVRAYTPILVLGTLATLAYAAAVTVPVSLRLLARPVHTITSGAPPVRIGDAVVTLAVMAGFGALWVRVWWRHGERVRRLAARQG